MPVDQVEARTLLVGDVVRLSDSQAHRIERVMIADGRVVLERRPVGLAVSETVRVALPWLYAEAAVIDCLGWEGSEPAFSWWVYPGILTGGEAAGTPGGSAWD